MEDLREEFVADYVYPMFRANTIYEGEYLLGTSIARPLIAKRLVEIANLINSAPGIPEILVDLKDPMLALVDALTGLRQRLQRPRPMAAWVRAS